MDLPVICTLTEEQLRERRAEILETFRANTHRVESIPGGYVYTFGESPTVLSDLAKLVGLERQCCQFLTFKIIVEPHAVIKLEISGPPEAGPTIAEFFGS